MSLSYQSVDALQNAFASTVFARTNAPKKAAGRALGTLVELITFYMIRGWGLEQNLAIERGIPEYGNPGITHNVEFTRHPSERIAVAAVPEDGRTITPTLIRRALSSLDLGDAKIPTGRALLRGGTVRHACNFAETADHFWNAHLFKPDQYLVVKLARRPYAMFECKRVGVEEGQNKGPQTIEKAKQGAYVARSVSGLQRVPRRDGSVSAIVEEGDGTLVTHTNYQDFLRETIDSGNLNALENIVLTVGVVSNHGNWFTSQEHNKEMRVLAQSYDWLLFIKDSALVEFIETVLQGEASEFAATRRAFALSHSGERRSTTFTKVTINLEADQELTTFFADKKPWCGWFTVITPERAPLEDLCRDLHKLSSSRGSVA